MLSDGKTGTSKKAKFITLEGIEGVGKSTAVNFLCEYLTARKIPVLMTREPGGTPLAEAIRSLLLKQSVESITPDAELLLLFAARAQHITQVIQPQLSQGVWVVSDRFVDASFAYQGGGRHIDLARITALANWTLQDCMPNLTLLLDAPVATGLARMRQRGKAMDRIEQETESFFERVRQVYLDRAAEFPERFRVIAANQSWNQVQIALQRVLDEWLLLYPPRCGV